MTAEAPQHSHDHLAPGCATHVTHLECGLTGDRVEPDRRHNLSTAGKPYLVRYDLDAIRAGVDRDALTHRPADLWRWRELLPVRDPANIISLGEGETPLVRLDRIDPDLVVKDEGRLPTGSFKARGAALAVSMAKELGITRMAMPTNGNAGSALSAYATRAGIAAYIFCPDDAPAIMMSEMAAQGAVVRRVDGLIDDCGEIVAGGVEAMGWFDCSTLKEPYRLEGKKTMGLELALQMGWRLPDVILYPTGGGTALIGMWKAFAELRALGWIDGPLPRMVAVQSTGCAPMVRAFEAGLDHAERWSDAATVATGIRVPRAVGDFLILRTLAESGGFAIAVPDEEIVAARDEIAAREGLLTCLEGAATYAAWKHARADGRIAPGESCVLFNCATGLKYPMPDVHERLDMPVDYAHLPGAA